MAQEVLILDKDALIFFKRYDSAPIVILGEAQVLTSPSSALPPLAADALGAAGIADIDDGKTSWQTTVLAPQDGESDASYEARAQAKWVIWDEREGSRIAEWADQIANGRWLDV